MILSFSRFKMLILHLGLFFTQQILGQNNFTMGNFSEQNNFIKLITDIDMTKLVFTHNSINFSARLDGNGHKITDNNSSPIFNKMMGYVYNITFDAKIANIFENGQLIFVNVTKQPFTNLQSCNISHIILQSQLGDAIINSLVTDIKIQNVKIATDLSYTNVQNIVMELNDQTKISKYIFAQTFTDSVLSNAMIYAQKLSFQGNDSYFIISQVDNSLFNKIIFSAQNLELNGNSSFTFIGTGYNISMNQSTINVDEIVANSQISQALIIQTIQYFNISGNVVKIGKINGTTTKQYSLIYLTSYQSYDKYNIFENNLIIINEYFQDKGYINFISEVIEFIEINNNHMQINNLTMVEKTRQYSTLGYKLDNSKLQNNTVEIPISNITYHQTTTQNLRLNYLVTKLSNTQVSNLQLNIQQQIVQVTNSTSQFQFNGISNEIKNVSLENISVVFNNFTCKYNNLTIYISGLGFEASQTTIQNMHIQFNNVNITNNVTPTRAQNNFYGIGKDLTDFSFSGGTININLLQNAQNILNFMLITLKDNTSANFSLQRVYGYFNEPNNSYYQGGIIQLQASNCYVTKPNKTNSQEDACQELNISQIQDNNIVGVQTTPQMVLFLHDIFYVSNNQYINWKHYLDEQIPKNILYGTLEPPVQSNNFTYTVKCTQNNVSPFTCAPLTTTKASCNPGTFGYGCILNNCYFTTPNSCSGYFPIVGADQGLDLFGNVVTYQQTECMHGKYVNRLCLCDLGFIGSTCNAQDCTTYLKLGQKCVSDDMSEIFSTCTENGMCLCNNKSYYVESNDTNGQKCKIGCNKIKNGICIGMNQALCDPGYQSPTDENDYLCSISECVNISDYEQCGGSAKHKCFGQMCMLQQDINQCENGCNGQCFATQQGLQCINYCSTVPNSSQGLCIQIRCQNNCFNNGLCVVSQPNQHIIPNNSSIITVGQCNCFDKLMLGNCDQCSSEYHLYGSKCLPNNCNGFYDSLSCQLKAGYVVGVLIGVLILIGIIIGIVFLTLFFLKRKRHKEAVYNKIQSDHLEMLHYNV